MFSRPRLWAGSRPKPAVKSRAEPEPRRRPRAACGSGFEFGKPLSRLTAPASLSLGRGPRPGSLTWTTLPQHRLAFPSFARDLTLSLSGAARAPGPLPSFTRCQCLPPFFTRCQHPPFFSCCQCSPPLVCKSASEQICKEIGDEICVYIPPPPSICWCLMAWPAWPRFLLPPHSHAWWRYPLSLPPSAARRTTSTGKQRTWGGMQMVCSPSLRPSPLLTRTGQRACPFCPRPCPHSSTNERATGHRSTVPPQTTPYRIRCCCCVATPGCPPCFTSRHTLSSIPQTYPSSIGTIYLLTRHSAVWMFH